jgi:hypothetical protein
VLDSTFASDIAHAVSRGVGEGADAELLAPYDRRLAPCAITRGTDFDDELSRLLGDE